MMKRYLLFLLVAMAVLGCKKNRVVVPGEPEVEPPVVVVKTDTAAFTSVKLEASHNPAITADINFTINPVTNEISGVIPTLTSGKKWVLTYTTQSAGTLVMANDTIQTVGATAADFSKPVTYALKTPKGNTKTYKVSIKNFTGLPILYLTTSGPVVSKDNYVTGSVTVNPNMDFVQDQLTIPLQIKGRGNSTWSQFPKKPYRLKFTNKAAMLGMPAAKNWVLLANYADKTLMRVRLAYELGRRLKSDFASQSRFVEVVMNGQYLGNYLLTSQIEVHENRVNITEMKASSSDISGGYLIELDQRLDADYWFRTTDKNLPFTIKAPEDITPVQLAYIKKYMNDFETALFGPDYTDPEKGYAKYINVDSFINWFFTEEIMKNQDGWDFSSIFYYKDKNGKLGMGPVWDFDLSLGNVDYSISKDPNDWYVKNATYFNRLFKDYHFRLKVKQRWDEIKNNEVKQILAEMDANEAYLNLSQQQNFTKWPILDKYVWPNNVVLGNYNLEVGYIKNFLLKRIAWIDSEISHF